MAIKKELTGTERKALAIKLEKIACSARKKKIYEYRNGLKDGIVRSLAETGKKFKITGEAVRLACKSVEALFTK